MALPIRPTPKLNVKESEIFLRKMAQNANKKVVLVTPPNLSNAEEQIEKYGRDMSPRFIPQSNFGDTIKEFNRCIKELDK